MKAIRYTAAAATLLMALANLPVAFTADDTVMSAPLRWAGTLAGAAGMVAGIALLRRAPWAALAVAGIGVLNLAGGVYAIGTDLEGGPIGVVLGALAAVCGGIVARAGESRSTSPSPA